MAYQGTFAIITAALISGAVVERMRFGPYLAFIALWTVLVYAPVAHWVWGGGWLMTGRARLRGRTVVHINAGVVGAGRRAGAGRAEGLRPPGDPAAQRAVRAARRRPALVRLVRVQRGSALAANELAALAFTNTFLAPMATLVVWVLLDYFRPGARRPSAGRRAS